MLNYKYTFYILLYLSTVLLSGCGLEKPAAVSSADGLWDIDTSNTTPSLIQTGVRLNMNFNDNSFDFYLYVADTIRYLDFTKTEIEISYGDSLIHIDTLRKVSSNYYYYRYPRIGQTADAGKIVSLQIGNPYFGFIRENFILPFQPKILSVFPAEQKAREDLSQEIQLWYDAAGNDSTELIVSYHYSRDGSSYSSKLTLPMKSSPFTFTPDKLDFNDYDTIEFISLSLQSSRTITLNRFREGSSLKYSGKQSDKILLLDQSKNKL